MTRTTIQKLGFWFSIAAFVALGLTAVASNRNLGLGYTITRRDRLGLLNTAIMLCVLQLVRYLLAHGKEDNHAKRNKWP